MKDQFKLKFVRDGNAVFITQRDGRLQHARDRNPVTVECTQTHPETLVELEGSDIVVG